MKQVEKRKSGESQRGHPQTPALCPLDADIIRFVEALAVADARRDHLVAANTTSVGDRGGRNLSSQAEASTNDSRSRLRPILD
jgi:hypothetical protein